MRHRKRPHGFEGRRRLVALLLAGFAAPALAQAGPKPAACPIERATYRQGDAAVLAFAPTEEAATVANAFHMTVQGKAELDGIVQWTEGDAGRSFGTLFFRCPEGDVTGAELDACTAWEGVIYALDEAGAVGLLPAEGKEAPPKLLLSGLGPALRFSAAYEAAGLSVVPWDVFELEACVK